MASIVHGGGGSLKAVLLWTNSNPTTQNTGFSVNVDFSKYTAAIISCRAYIDNANTDDTNIVYKNGGTQWVHAHASDTRLNGRRVTTFNDSKITFSNGFVGASGNNDGRACIPQKIWGVKVKGVS